MRIKQYVVCVQHDNGITRIRTAARNKMVARDIIMNAERCPARAIKSVEVYKY